MPKGDSPVQEKKSRQPTMGAPRSASPQPGVTPSKFLISSQIIIHDVKTIPRPVATRNSLHIARTDHRESRPSPPGHGMLHTWHIVLLE